MNDTTGDLLGSVDDYSNSAVTGWAFSSVSAEPVAVELVIDGVSASRTLADRQRTGASLGTPIRESCGFTLSIPSDYADGKEHDVVVRLSATAQTIGSARLSIALRSTESDEFPALLGSKPAISLILPTYNRGERMEDTVERFLACATSVAAEIVVVDDGSTDDTPERLKRLAAKHANLRYESIANGGPGNARNRAAATARGDLLLYIGDDVAPEDDAFIETHLAAHAKFSRTSLGVLGKIKWPNVDDLSVSYVMGHVQGEGQQQFGFKHLKPYEWYDWKFFYSSNVSVKRALVDDWLRDGYDTDFYLAAFEDAEFAYRMSKKYRSDEDDFRILYVPAAALVHYHPYDVESFNRRQFAAGMMARVFIAKHPEVAKILGLSRLDARLHDAPSGDRTLPIEHYYAMIEGLKSWAVVTERHYGLGAQNWHDDLLKAIFQLSFLEGYMRSSRDVDANFASGARYILETFRTDFGQAMFRESLGAAADFEPKFAMI